MAAHSESLQILTQRGFSRILKEEVRFAAGDGDSAADRVNGWFDRLMLQSGIQTTPRVWLLLCALAGFAFAGFGYLLTERVSATALGFIAGLTVPLLAATIMRSRRQQKILEQLPAMAEELARTARTGRNLEGALQVVAADTPAPLGDELRLVVRRSDMGIDLRTAARDLPERTGVAVLTMLVSAISLHQETGGDLIRLLERLAASTRDRLHFASRLRAATIASRMGAILMLVIPPLVVLFYVFRDPGYLERLTATFPGRLSFGIAIGLQVIGAFSVFRILKRCARF